MFSFNDQRWPIIVFEYEGLQSLSDHMHSLKVWDTQFEREGPFVAVRIFRDKASLTHPKGAGQATRSWLKSGAQERIRSCVSAMINIVPDTTYEAMKQKSVEDVFGVPGGVFKSAIDAASWFNASIGPSINLTLMANHCHTHK